MSKILLLGGTTEANLLARQFAKAGADAVYSYAGRTHSPKEQPIHTRIGGFGGIDGLVRYLRDNAISHVVDATHPFAAQMTRNAVAACAVVRIPYLGFERQAWARTPQDCWTEVPDLDAAIAALPAKPTRIFLAIGRQVMDRFAGLGQHHYVARVVDAPTQAWPENFTIIIDRGPFTVEDDTALLLDHKIDLIIAKNAGGTGAYAKIRAARDTNVPIIMIDRPQLPDRFVTDDVEVVMAHVTAPA